MEFTYSRLLSRLLLQGYRETKHFFPVFVCVNWHAVIWNQKQPISEETTSLWTLCRLRLGGTEDRCNKSEGYTLDVLFLLDVYTTNSRHCVS